MTGASTKGQLAINEIIFYKGIVHKDTVLHNDTYMTTPRYPVPQTVTCSSFVDQNTHCYRAFDGDLTAHSAWVSKPIGERDFILATSQWILFDFGQNRYSLPTAMKIVCDNGYPSNPRRCPRTFVLEGSKDNKNFDRLLNVNLIKYHNEYADGGEIFNFVWDTHIGRPNGIICGSCISATATSCALAAYDGTCSSTYCSINGLCAEQPKCPPGSYMQQTFSTAGLPSITCQLCPPGTYGAMGGLNSSMCSGLCQEGYYCQAGSLSATEHECGASYVFCPRGSTAPMLSGAGRKTIGGTNNMTRISDTLCQRGFYCVRGEEYLCPIGVFGDVEGLSSELCVGFCVAGEYCPAGTIKPFICPLGHYCPDGRVAIPCPAGTYGNVVGKNRDSYVLRY